MDRRISSATLFSSSLALAAIGIVCLGIYFLVDNWRYRLREKALGCGRPNRLRNKLPYGIDYLLTLVKADRENRVPQQLLKISREVKSATFVQNFAGHDSIGTSDPKNIQALLALQFKDFGLGPRRRQNFYPMLGNGIFTADGEMWCVSETHLCHKRMTPKILC